MLFCDLSNNAVFLVITLSLGDISFFLNFYSSCISFLFFVIFTCKNLLCDFILFRVPVSRCNKDISFCISVLFFIYTSMLLFASIDNQLYFQKSSLFAAEHILLLFYECLEKYPNLVFQSISASSSHVQLASEMKGIRERVLEPCTISLLKKRTVCSSNNIQHQAPCYRN